MKIRRSLTTAVLAAAFFALPAAGAASALHSAGDVRPHCVLSCTVKPKPKPKTSQRCHRTTGKHRVSVKCPSKKQPKHKKPAAKPKTGTPAKQTTGVTGATGTTGSTGATVQSGGSTGTGSTGSTPPPAAPVTPAPPVPPAPVIPTGPGTQSILLPAGFAPIASYTTLAKDYEFTGNALPAGWAAGTSNYGNEATQYVPSQVTMTGSAAALTAVEKTSPAGFPYESGWLWTYPGYSFEYGMVDFRLKTPAGQGLWPGAWMLAYSSVGDQPETDVMEMLLGDTHTIYGSAHCWPAGFGAQLWSETQSTYMSADASQSFNDYQVIWEPGMITWAVDGVAYAQYTQAQASAAGQPWPFDIPQFLIADLAVAGPDEWGGPPNTNTVIPATLLLASVKVWQ